MVTEPKDVQFLKLDKYNLSLKTRLIQKLDEVIEGGQYILGDHLAEFEKSFSDYCGVSGSVGVANGLDALKLILEGYGIGHEDEVIVPAFTFIATWLAVSAVGANPVPVEIEENGFNISIDEIEKAITTRTKAIIAVHLYGIPCNTTKLKSLCEAHDLKLIEDAAQAHGAFFGGDRVGSLGHAAAFSFYPSKNLGCLGDGGLVASSDLTLLKKVQLLRNYGSNIKYVHEIIASNSRLDDLQASFLMLKLSELDAQNAWRGKLVSRYQENLKHANAKLPTVPAGASPVWHLFPILIENRDKVMKKLSQNGIQTSIHYPIPPFKQKAYHNKYNISAFKRSIYVANSTLSLPLGPLMTFDEVDYVSENLMRALK